MQVNLYRFLQQLLPSFLRDIKLVEIMRMLIVQVEWARIQFNSFVPDWLYKINANGSVVSLQHHIARELDVDAVITSLDGLPVDFLITINGFVDENRIKSLVESYKLAGKSYVFKIGSVVYTAQYSGHVCEDIREVYTSEFSDYVCETDLVISISGTADNTDGWEMTLTASSLVGSDILCRGIIYYVNTSGAVDSTDIFNHTIVAGTLSITESIAIPGEGVISAYVIITSLDPVEDSTYSYVISNN